MNPLYICLTGSESLGPAELKVSHELGSSWRGKADMKWIFSSSTWGPGCYTRKVPIYDITNPLEISLTPADGESLQKEVELKDNWAENTFPLGVGLFPPDMPLLEARISPNELPEEWETYGAISSLWLGRKVEDLSRKSELEIVKWVFQGGTLVLFAGSNYPHLQNTPLGGMIPFSEPRLIRQEERYMHKVISIPIPRSC